VLEGGGRTLIIYHSQFPLYIFIGIPLSTKKKKGSWFCNISILGKTQYVLLY